MLFHFHIFELDKSAVALKVDLEAQMGGFDSARDFGVLGHELNESV